MTPSSSLGSLVLGWEQLVAKPTAAGSFRALFDGPTATLKNFEGHVTTLNPGLSPHPPHQHPDEEFVVLKEGALEVTINGVTQHAAAGAVLFIASNELHGWKNPGALPAVYYVFRFVTR